MVMLLFARRQRFNIVKFYFPVFRLKLPLPERISMQLASLPDYFVGDVAEFLLFVNM